MQGMSLQVTIQPVFTSKTIFLLNTILVFHAVCNVNFCKSEILKFPSPGKIFYFRTCMLRYFQYSLQSSESVSEAVECEAKHVNHTTVFYRAVGLCTPGRLTTGPISQSYLGPAITSTCGPLVANHPQMGHSSETPPNVASFWWMNLGQWLDLPFEPVSNSPWVGAGRRKITIMSDVGFEPTTSRLCARSSNH